MVGEGAVPDCVVGAAGEDECCGAGGGAVGGRGEELRADCPGAGGQEGLAVGGVGEGGGDAEGGGPGTGRSGGVGGVGGSVGPVFGLGGGAGAGAGGVRIGAWMRGKE